ncbi:MAG TPA: DNA polymerase III subunit delta [Xanthobacteraceae bacterium]|jgi:DNA polymerase-3 subunit delta|nr:DNA polymerase III subunit delta [Xanthobacteraceae bacterium]
MVAVKAADVDAFVARPDPVRRVVLVFGPDAGLIGERVRAVLAASVDDMSDPFALARLNGEELAAEPTRLVEEALTMPLFGGRRAVWVKAGSRNIAPAVEALLDDPLFAAARECRVVIEAGDLRRNAPLRVLCERAKNATALPCYADSERDRARLIDDEMRAAGLSLAPDARAVLIPLLGGDRAASRSEIQKLALYARGRDQVSVEDVTAVVSDASALAIEDIVDAAFAGRPGELEIQLGKARVAGTTAGSILFNAQRQLAQLHKWRTAIEQGRPISLEAVQPPLPFRRRPLVEAALKTWSATRLATAMAELAEAVLQSRLNPALADTIAERALLAIAANGRRSAA